MAKKHQRKIFKRKKTIGQKVMDFFRMFDFYGKNIVLTYKGDDKYRTHVGGIASVIVGGVVFVYIIYLFLVMINRGNTSFAKTSFIHNIFEDSEPHFPAYVENDTGTGSSNFDIAFKLSSSSGDYLLNEDYFEFSIKLVEQEWVNEGGVAKTQRNKTSIDFEL